MSKSLSALLEEILTSAQLVQAYIGDLSKDAFMASTQLQDAVLRRIEIIGEGVKNIPREWCATLTQRSPGDKSHVCAMS